MHQSGRMMEIQGGLKTNPLTEVTPHSDTATEDIQYNQTADSRYPTQRAHPSDKVLSRGKRRPLDPPSRGHIFAPTRHEPQTPTSESEPTNYVVTRSHSHISRQTARYDPDGHDPQSSELWGAISPKFFNPTIVSTKAGRTSPAPRSRTRCAPPAARSDPPRPGTSTTG